MMANTSLKNADREQNCKFCPSTSKSKSGLQYHIQKMHQLDVDSGLSCFSCNKMFSKRDLIENHFKTVKHQLECKRLLESDKVEMTTFEYRRKLFQMNNFGYRPYRKRRWESDETLPIPLEKEQNCEVMDPRLRKRSRKTNNPKNEVHTDQVQADTQKAVIWKFTENCQTINIEDLLVIKVPTKPATTTIGPVMFKVIENTILPRSTQDLKELTGDDQKNAKMTEIIPNEKTTKLQGTEHISNKNSTRSTPESTMCPLLHLNEVENTSGNTDTRKYTENDQLQQNQEDSPKFRLNATSCEEATPTATRSTLESMELQDTVIL